MKLIHTIGSLFLALLVMVASSNFFIGMHVCGGEVNAIALLDDADGCGHANLPPCHQKMMKGCCTDQQIEHAAQELKQDVNSISFPVLAAVSVVHTPVVLSDLMPSAIKPFTGEYHPPARAVDFTVLHEVFLI